MQIAENIRTKTMFIFYKINRPNKELKPEMLAQMLQTAVL